MLRSFVIGRRERHMPKSIKKVSDLVPDAHNANVGTERGSSLLESSLRKYGAGRSILVDKNGNIIAGNKTAEHAVDVGIEDVIVVPTDGKRLVVVQRTDLDLDKDKAARELAVADNRVGQLDLDWNAEELLALKEHYNINLEELGFYDADVKPMSVEELWKGMPEFEQEALDAFRTIRVCFTSAKDIAAFAKLLRLAVTEKTKIVWFPRDKAPKLAGAYVDDKTPKPAKKKAAKKR